MLTNKMDYKDEKIIIYLNDNNKMKVVIQKDNLISIVFEKVREIVLHKKFQENSADIEFILNKNKIFLFNNYPLAELKFKSYNNKKIKFKFLRKHIQKETEMMIIDYQLLLHSERYKVFYRLAKTSFSKLLLEKFDLDYFKNMRAYKINRK